MGYCYWKPIIFCLFLLSATTALLANAADDEFYLEEKIQIICANEDRPGDVCQANGEVRNINTSGGIVTVSFGNGVCLNCPTNQAADIIACDAEAECTCIKCNSTDVTCGESIGECVMPSASGETSKSTSMTFVSALVITLASAVMML
jgi:hypothetical protein